MKRYNSNPTGFASQEIPVKIEPELKLVLHQQWISGSHGDYEYEMSNGSGLGNAMLKFRIKHVPSGREVHGTSDISEVFKKWLDRAIEHLENCNTSEARN